MAGLIDIYLLAHRYLVAESLIDHAIVGTGPQQIGSVARVVFGVMEN